MRRNGQRKSHAPPAILLRASGLIGALLLLPYHFALADDGLLETVIEAEKSRVEVIARAVRPTIAVFESGGQGGGSGVVISPDGYALTNFHVVQPCGQYMQCGMSDGELYDAVVVGIDPTGDVALIKLTGREDFPVAEFGDSDDLRIGDWCFTIGNPFLLATDFQPSVAYGIVSGVHRYQYPAGTLLEYADCIQTDAAINPGNSGGPLFDAQGRLVGINGRCSFEKRGRVNVGVGYAISINQIRKFLGYLHSGRIVDHATLGATVATGEDGRVLVTNILESSDAFRRGLRFNSEIVSLGGREIRSANALKNILGTYPRGWRVPLTFLDEGELHDVTVRLSGVHAREELLKKVQGARRIQPEGPKPRKQPAPGEPRPETPPRPKAPAKRLIPKHIQDQIIARDGYANYYFNQLHRNRIWNALVTRSGSFPQGGEWTLSGVTADGDDFEFVLRDNEALATMADGPHRVDLAGDIETQMQQHVLPNGEIVFGLPPAEGTLLALAMWRRFLIDEPTKFGDVYYLGTAPLPNRQKLTDVLVATRGVVENHLYFESVSGRLLAIESFPDADTDPYELRFVEETDADGRKMPGRITARLGDLILGDYRITRQTFSEVANGAEG